ncbi:family 16 glycosylhydrolase [Microvirga sp. 2TAF3]|uniref:family 16 glycosylhydrolase n=1 Tax=Microvirga sp. 2TAF3 TaxID=3233014 RepID=UPI003F96CD37
MTLSANTEAVAEHDIALPGAMQPFRHAKTLRWLGRPLAYTIGTALASLLSIGTSLLAPSLLGPAAFGSFALLTSLFQYASKFDLGLSQLADQELAAKEISSVERGVDILRANWAIGSLLLAIITPLAALAAFASGQLSPFDTALALSGGAFSMIANAPVTLFRAGTQIWEFTAVALTLQAGMTAPRLTGLVVGGVTGCFAMLVLWYGALAGFFARLGPSATRKPAPILSLWRTALPLFAFNALWLVYMTANRWISAALSTPEELGLFAFGANLAFVGLGLISTTAQVYYPTLLTRIARLPRGSCSGQVERQALYLGIFLAGIATAAIVTARPIISRLFPHFEQAAPATVALALSCVSLGVVAWLIPIVIALSSRPRRDAATTFIPSFLILIAAMAIGSGRAGIEGQAWGCVAAAFVLFTRVTFLMRLFGVVRGWAFIRMLTVQLLLIGPLSGFTLFRAPDPQLTITAYRGPAGTEVVPPPGWTLAFADHFDRLRFWSNGSDGIWEPHYPWGARTNAPNGERQYYVDPRPGQDSQEVLRLNPYSIKNGVLTIRARPFPKSGQMPGPGLNYASGLLSSAKSFAFTYGYVEMRAKLPPGKGLWSAFWLAPTDQSWPPEIDVLEGLGQDMNSYTATVHTTIRGSHTQAQIRVLTPDLSKDFHTFAVKWTAGEIVWYFDGRRVASMKTPDDMHKPMYMIANLAVGGFWPGFPDETTPFPGDLQIDHIRAYLPPGASR